VPDAYHLPSSPGAAYLKTADGDMVRFQTAFVSAPHARAQAVRRPDGGSAPRLFTAAPAGRVTEPEHAPERPASAHTLMHTVLNQFAGQGTPAHPVWLPSVRQ